jgi:hypothetical protein
MLFLMGGGGGGLKGGELYMQRYLYKPDRNRINWKQLCHYQFAVVARILTTINPESAYLRFTCDFCCSSTCRAVVKRCSVLEF